MGSGGHDDGAGAAGKVWLAQVICRLVYSVYQDTAVVGNHDYNNGSAAGTTEMVMTTTTNANRLLLTESRVDQLDCGGTWTLDCHRETADDGTDGALSCTDALSAERVSLFLPARLRSHFDGQAAVSVGLPETARGRAVTVRCDGGGDGDEVTCSVRGELWPPPPPPSPPPLTPYDRDDDGSRWYNWKYLFVIVFIASGGVGNILVCLAICLDRQLQNVTNYFLLSLAIADLLVCLFVMPLGAIPGFYGEFFGFFTC